MRNIPFAGQPLFNWVMRPLLNVLSTQDECVLKGSIFLSAGNALLGYEGKEPYRDLFSHFKIKEKMFNIEKIFVDFGYADLDEDVSKEKKDEFFNKFKDEALKLVRIVHLLNFIFLHVSRQPEAQFLQEIFSNTARQLQGNQLPDGVFTEEQLRMLDVFPQSSMQAVSNCHGNVNYQERQQHSDIPMEGGDCNRIISIVKFLPTNKLDKFLELLFADMEDEKCFNDAMSMLRVLVPQSNNFFTDGNNTANLKFFEQGIKDYRKKFLSEFNAFEQLENQHVNDEEEEPVSLSPRPN